MSKAESNNSDDKRQETAHTHAKKKTLRVSKTLLAAKMSCNLSEVFFVCEFFHEIRTSKKVQNKVKVRDCIH